MPLYDVTGSKDQLVLPSEAEQYGAIQKAKRELNGRTFDKMVRTVDTAISNVKPSESSKLVWTKAAALVGHSSPEPLRDVDHLWRSVEKVYGNDDEFCRKLVGGLIRWRISILVEDTWLVYRSDTGELNIHGKKITVSHYWIDNTYVPPAYVMKKVTKIKADPSDVSLAELAARFNKSKKPPVNHGTESYHSN